MKKRKLLTILCSAAFCLGCALPAAAAPVDYINSPDGLILPSNIVINNNRASITRGLWNQVTCKGTTGVPSGYTAEVIVELRQDGTTIQRWSDKGGTKAMVTETYYASPGHSYYVYATHKAYNGSGGLVETLYSSSNTISY